MFLSIKIFVNLKPTKKKHVNQLNQTKDTFLFCALRSNQEYKDDQYTKIELANWLALFIPKKKKKNCLADKEAKISNR